MKKLVTVFLAATILAAPMAQAQAQGRHDYGHDRRGVHERTVTTKKVIIKKHRWDRGQRLTPAQRRHFVDRREYRRYHLREPRRNERWVRVDNQFLLINAVSGLIIGLAAAR